jgi:branched-chain amino acid transport system substrate-binding protein
LIKLPTFVLLSEASMILRSLRRLVVALTVPALVFAVASAADQPALKIGIIFTFSGGGPPIGKALDAAIGAYQATHGDTVAGRKVVFVRRDDGGVAPELAKREATELIVNEKVDALYGFMLSPNAIAVGSISTEAKKPVFITNAATSGILAPNPYMARFSFTEAQVAAPLGQWAAKHDIKTAYGVFLDYGSGHEAMDAFAKAFTANGGTMLGTVAVPMSNMNYAAYIQRVKDAHPNAVFAFVGPQAGGEPFMKSYEDGGCAAAGIKLLATNDLVLDENLPVFGDGIIGAITSANYSSSLDTPVNKAFIKAYEAAYGSPQLPDFSAVAAYDALDALYHAVQAQHGNFDPDKTMELLKGMKIASPRGPIMIDPQTRDIVQNIYIQRTEKRGNGYVNVPFDTIPMVKPPVVSQ